MVEKGRGGLVKYLAGGAIISLGVIAAPALADVTQGDLDEEREQVRLVTNNSLARSAAYSAAVAPEAALINRLDRLVVGLTSRERDLVQARRAAQDRCR